MNVVPLQYRLIQSVNRKHTIALVALDLESDFVRHRPFGY